MQWSIFIALQVAQIFKNFQELNLITGENFKRLPGKS